MKAFFSFVLTVAVALVIGFALAMAAIDITSVPEGAQARIIAFKAAVPQTFVVLFTALLLVYLTSRRLRHVPYNLLSAVAGHTGLCVPTWLNKNRIDYMTTGAATGFFRRGRRLWRLPFVWLSGPEFHGYIREGRVLSTEGIYGRVPA